MVKVCDAIMGSGKSSAAITYINEHPEKKFIYITPYIDEATRIKDACPTARFVEPSNAFEKHRHSKVNHTSALIKEGRNIASTHQAFKFYEPDMLDDIKTQGYTLIVDENMEILEKSQFNPEDLKLLIEAGYINASNETYTLNREDYRGSIKDIKDILRFMKTRELIRIGAEDGAIEDTYYWALPPDLFTAFEDVFILTYLFEGQGLHHFLHIYDIPYQYIGIERISDNKYRFGAYPGYIPEYIHTLRDRIHLLDEQDKLNDIGRDKWALSVNWFSKDYETKLLKNNLYNWFVNKHAEIPSKHRLWGGFKATKSPLRGNGYTSAFTSFNIRATNSYRDRNCLAYTSNVFMNPNEKIFYQSKGVNVDEDKYALSFITQWIWRSAIRDGGEIYLYIPSKRMRDLFNKWLDDVSKGGVSVA